MTPPPIRYPLPTLVVLVALGLLAWRGRDWVASVSEPVWAGIDRLRSGPPFPESTEPMRREGAIARKVLVLREGVSVTDVPGGAVVESIRRRIFADVYDVWPLGGTPTHYRIGNRQPIGWVEADAVLPWDTRLVVRPVGSEIRLRTDPADERGSSLSLDGTPLPIVEWGSDAVRVAVWDRAEPWGAVDRWGWVRLGELPPDAIGVLLTRSELLELLRIAIEPERAGAPPPRVLAMLGMVDSGASLTAEQAEGFRRTLPDSMVRIRGLADGGSVEQLGRINDFWSPDVMWSGIAYQAIPLSSIPGE
ncbi:hypothetical protein AB1L88_04930 [Tautonia sp. JC769]|uniref:hypothetical protein n=1 Tax=Tautonia sp. JC769 TaxID=3232135 RepID=UPI0034589E29